MSEFGTYRHRLSVQQEHPVADTGGGQGMGWTTLDTVWASIMPVSGRERWMSGQMTTMVTHRIRMRFDSTITPAMRFVMGDRVFNIRSILNVEERNRTLDILVEEGVAT